MRWMLSCPNTSSWRSGISFCSTRIHTSFEAFKLANYYMFGKPVTIVAGAEEPPPIKINISAIPKFRVSSKT